MRYSIHFITRARAAAAAFGAGVVLSLGAGAFAAPSFETEDPWSGSSALGDEWDTVVIHNPDSDDPVITGPTDDGPFDDVSAHSDVPDLPDGDEPDATSFVFPPELAPLMLPPTPSLPSLFLDGVAPIAPLSPVAPFAGAPDTFVFVTPTSIPAPGAFGLAGLVGLSLARRRRSR